MQYAVTFDDGRGQYPDRIAASAPRGFREHVKRAAKAEQISLAAFIRRAVERQLVEGKADKGTAR